MKLVCRRLVRFPKKNLKATLVPANCKAYIWVIPVGLIYPVNKGNNEFRGKGRGNNGTEIELKVTPKI
jgi:hypothetical protein